MSKTCKECVGVRLERDRGQLYCPQCGKVYEEVASLVNASSFEEGNSGTFVRTGSQSSGSQRSVASENAKRRIHELANKLTVTSKEVVDRANEFYDLARLGSAVHGRPSEHVYAVCLYMSCRLNKTEHLLADFVDALGASEKNSIPRLGKTFTSLCRKLSLETQIPIVDPSIYISRFASQLEFGSQTQEVANYALNIIKKMGRSWIQTGRRPAGIIGAALIIAARVHGFLRNTDEVVSVVRIGDKTLRKRINEFLALPAASLTPLEFEKKTEAEGAVGEDEDAKPPVLV